MKKVEPFLVTNGYQRCRQGKLNLIKKKSGYWSSRQYRKRSQFVTGWGHWMVTKRCRQRNLHEMSYTIKYRVETRMTTGVAVSTERVKRVFVKIISLKAKQYVQRLIISVVQKNSVYLNFQFNLINSWLYKKTTMYPLISEQQNRNIKIISRFSWLIHFILWHSIVNENWFFFLSFDVTIGKKINITPKGVYLPI